MKYAILYSSKTGNTALLAEKLKEILPQKNCVCYGEPSEKAEKADLIFVGFWTDRGDCDTATSSFLSGLQGKAVFLFGTAGFGGSETYFSQILSRVQSHLAASNTVVGTFMCQGKMPLSVRQRYDSLKTGEPDKMQELIDNFDRALSHPDAVDLSRLEQAVKKHL